MMKDEERKDEKKKIYVEPKVMASYQKEELEEMIKPQGQSGGYGGCGCG